MFNFCDVIYFTTILFYTSKNVKTLSRTLELFLVKRGLLQSLRSYFVVISLYNHGKKYSGKNHVSAISPLSPNINVPRTHFSKSFNIETGGRGSLAFFPVVWTFFTTIVDQRANRCQKNNTKISSLNNLH